MTPQRFVRVFGALFRVSLAEAAAYRLESFVWLLSTTMPLVMLSLFAAVAAEAPVGRFTQEGFIAYFLSTFIVRTTTGSWASWQMNMDIRDGSLAVKLLRPVPPLWSYATDNLAALPLRGVVAIPVATCIFLFSGKGAWTTDPVLWAFWLVAMVGTWLCNILTNLSIGCLTFFLESTLKIIDLYTVCFFLASGYLIPLEVFPESAAKVLRYLPFHFQLGLPVEIMTGAWTRSEALGFLGMQWAYVAFLAGLTQLLLKRGLRRFAAFGG